jgi:hypothetical protein
MMVELNFLNYGARFVVDTFLLIKENRLGFFYTCEIQMATLRAYHKGFSKLSIIPD